MVFKFESIEEFKNKIESKDISISVEVFNQIKKAFNDKRKRKQVTAFTLYIKKPSKIYFFFKKRLLLSDK